MEEYADLLKESIIDKVMKTNDITLLDLIYQCLSGIKVPVYANTVYPKSA